MQPGDHIGRYRIESLLGRGGMGEVFRAWDEVLQRRVAIKLLRAEASDDSGRSGAKSAPSIRRVLREARMAAGLRHPNVVAIFDVGEQDGAAYIVMEYVRGASLRALIPRTGATPDERVLWLAAIASALAAAHKQGLVHRDVKPDNVLVDLDGTVKVLDFGVARRDRPNEEPRRADGESPRSHSSRPPPPLGVSTTLGATAEDGRLVGTPAYMAPEQIRSESIDGRADQFAWAVTAYELLTGALPWPAPPRGRSLLDTVLAHEPAPLDAAALGISPRVAAAIQRALSKRRDDRFASMDDLLDALGHDRERSRRTGAVGTSIRVDGADSSIGLAPTAIVHETTTGSREPVAHTRAEVGGSRRRRAWFVAAPLVLVAIAGVALTARRAGKNAPSVAASSAQPTSAPSSSSSVAYASLRPRNVRRLTMQSGCQEFASITPDGREVVYDGTAGRDVHVYAIDVDTGAQRTLTEGAGWQWAPAVSPDGREIAYLRTERDATSAYTMPLDGKGPSRVLAEGSLRPRWSSDGRAIWAGAGRAPVRVDRETRKPTRTLTPPSGFRAVAVIEPADARPIMHLAQVEGHDSGGLVRYAAAGSGEAAPLEWLTHDGVDEAVLLMSDERSVLAPKVSRALRGQLTRFPLDGGAIEGITLAEVMPTKGFTRSRGGVSAARLAWSTCAERSELVTLRPRPGRAPSDTDVQPPTSLLGQTDWTDESPAWLPGTTKLLVASDRAQGRGLWALDVTSREPPRAIALGGLRAIAPSVSRDGAWVAFVSPAVGIYVAPLDGHAPPRRLTTGGDDGSPVFSYDGTTLYFQTPGPDRRPRISSLRLDDASATPAIHVVREHAARPSPGAHDGELAFVEAEGEAAEGAPMLLDVRSGAVRPLASSTRSGRFAEVRISPDGTRAALLGSALTEVLEIDLATGATRLRYDSGADEVKDVAYLDGDLIAAKQVWAGGIWVGEDGD